MKLLTTISTGALIWFRPAAQAAIQSSADYAITAETIDVAGLQASSADYGVTTELGDVGGTATSAATEIKSGFVGQLGGGAGLLIFASPVSLNENGGTRQLQAAQAIDETTTVPVDPSAIAWSVLTGPITSVSTSGLATGGIVYQNSGATVRGTYLGLTATVDLTVLDVDPDNFGTYAGDGLPDDWQATYFGLDNPVAAPTADPDFDGQTNLSEFVAGSVPTSGTSVFTPTIAAVPGQPNRYAITFGPILAGRTYQVDFSPDLAAGQWQPLTGFSQSDNGNMRTVTDLTATGTRRNYRVRITRP